VSRLSDDHLSAGSLRYVVECQPVHERLRDLLTQLGGLALMTMLRREGRFDCTTPLRRAREALSETSETLRRLPVPPGAAHHHHHMSEAYCAIERVCGLLSAGSRLGGAEAAKLELSRELRSAADHLRFASRAMPGFEMVDLAQSCCAAHAASAPLAETTELRF
jgi:hypothetical protein